MDSTLETIINEYERKQEKKKETWKKEKLPKLFEDLDTLKTELRSQKLLD